MLDTWKSQEFLKGEFLQIAVTPKEFLFCIDYFNYCIKYFDVCEEDHFDVLILIGLVRIQVIENRYLQQMLDIKLGKTFDNFLTDFSIGLKRLEVMREAHIEELSLNKFYKTEKYFLRSDWNRLSLENKKMACARYMLINLKNT